MLDRARCWSRVRERLFGWTSLNKLLALENKAGLALMKDSVCFLSKTGCCLHFNSHSQWHFVDQYPLGLEQMIILIVD